MDLGPETEAEGSHLKLVQKVAENVTTPLLLARRGGAKAGARW